MTMDTLTTFDPVQVLKDVYMLPSYCPIPNMGVLPMNAFLIRGEQPILIDTGSGPLATEFVDSLSTLMDLEDLRWLWLTHTDPDHVGAVELVLEAASKAQVVTTFLGAAKLGLHRPLPEERTHLINPGEGLEIGDRTLMALRPPVFDAPETIAAFDTSSRAFFAADCFGTLMSEPAATAEDIDDDALRDGLGVWAGIDTPWFEYASRELLAEAVQNLWRLQPSAVLSGHLPPSHGGFDRLGAHVLAAVDAAQHVELEDSASKVINAVF
jgi:glyoxylase-like metal-dependent hydrolase (beta-lactamase superfamily II)